MSISHNDDHYTTGISIYIFNIRCLNINGYIGRLNIHGTHVTATNSTNNNVVFFFVSDLKIVYYNNN